MLPPMKAVINGTNTKVNIRRFITKNTNTQHISIIEVIKAIDFCMTIIFEAIISHFPRENDLIAYSENFTQRICRHPH